jgi:AcrR family transcriptional regulator
MRADATRNRQKLLEALLELGADAALEAVARRAGVGIGTLYRHFPTREALIEAAYRTEVDHLGAIDDLLGTPDTALTEFVDRFVDYSQTKRGMAGVLDTLTAAGSSVRSEASAQIRQSVDALIAAGAVRSDVDAGDVLGALRAVWTADNPESARRIARVLVDGLRQTPA